MSFIIPWLFFSLAVGFLGNKRKIGFGAAFGISLVLSPLIGFILVLASKDIEDSQYEAQMMDTQQQQANALRDIKYHNTATSQSSMAEQLEKLSRLKDAGHLTDEEYTLAKNKVITSSV